MATLRLGRVYHFSAAHRLHSPYLSDEENLALYRDCNNPGGHGHNYVLELMVEGPMHPKLGMVMDLGELDRIVQERVLGRLDHQFIEAIRPGNPDDPAFISTSESVTFAIWSWLDGAFPEPVRLHSLHLEETRSNFFDYQGEDHPGRATP